MVPSLIVFKDTVNLVLNFVGRLHSVVFYPSSTEDVVRMVKIATKYRMPVIPYSGATSLEGQTRSVSR